MKCLKCKSENPEGTEFCRACGATLEKVCLKCHFSNPRQFRFCGDCGHKLNEAVETEKAIPASEAERKHATVLFSDLSGYTAMTERLDPEEVKEIMSRIFGEVGQVITKYEGFIERFFGDEVMAIFGAPKAHEDDPVRAIKAAREIHDVVKKMSPRFEDKIGQPLAMHTGINTGLLVTGDEYIGKGRHGLTGDTINVAARLTKLAQAGEVLVGPDTYRQAEGYFTFDHVEFTKVKGRAEPVQVYKVLSPKVRPTTIHRLSGFRADLIGRTEEMAQLGKALERLRSGEGSILSVSGDAGTGKSRLVEEFKATLNLEEIQWREGHAYAYSQNIPYFLMIDMMNRAWEIEESDPPEAVKKKVKSSIEYLLGKEEDVVPYVGSLYALDYPEIKGVTPEFWKSRLHRAMEKIFSAIAKRAPTVICMEDLHWAEPSSLDLLRFIVSENTIPVFFLCVYRPHFSLFIGDQIDKLKKEYREIQIRDFSPSEAQDMVGSLLKGKIIPHELLQFVKEKVEGNPFYLEEVINSLIESETLIRDNGIWKLAGSLSQSGISPTIHGVISGRVDRLEKFTKQILQEASVIGRAFHYDILTRITEREDTIDDSLSGLERLDLVRVKSHEPDLEYIFKHALTQEVVYNGILKKERCKKHERIGRAMEAFFKNRIAEFCETLAFHFTQGQSLHKAVHYLVKSGEKSLGRYSVEEADQFYKSAFEIVLDQANDFQEQEKLLIDILFKWALVLYYLGDFKRMAELFIRHRDLAESLDDMPRLGWFYAWLGFAWYARSNYKDSVSYLEKALEIGHEIQNQEIIGHACAWLSYNYGDLGRFQDAIKSAEKAHRISRLIDSDYLYFKPLGGIGLTCYFMGDSRGAFEAGKASLEFGIGHNNSRSLVLGHLCIASGHAVMGDIPSTIEYIRKSISAATDPLYYHMASFYLSMFLVETKEFHEAEKRLKEVLAFTSSLGAEWMKTPCSLFLGAVLMAKGHMNGGMGMIEEARRQFEIEERQFFSALAEYILGRLYLQIVQRDVQIGFSAMTRNIGFLLRNLPFASRKGEYHFIKSIEISENIGAKSLLGQAHLDLGLLHKAKRRTGLARKYLSKSVQIFRDIEAKVFLRQAKEALD